jgi:hypothetical protein
MRQEPLRSASRSTEYMTCGARPFDEAADQAHADRFEQSA